MFDSTNGCNADVDVCIIGAGISGLHSAYELSKKNVSIKLIEARSRLGGRIYSSGLEHSKQARFDIGPSWFWPGQSNIEQLVAELGLASSVYQQYAQGDAIYEPVGSEPVRGIGGVSMAGSYRVHGGLAKITDTLGAKIVEQAGQQTIQLDSRATHLELNDDGVLVTVRTHGETQRWQAKKVILAMPPRVALAHISMSPVLEAERVQELNKVATWMAGHAKAVIVYDTPFWREDGFSGDIISQRGPLSEIHDASLEYVKEYALFGFFAVPPRYRKTDKSLIDQQLIEQLTRLLGNKAAKPKDIIYKDWARDELVATSLDQHIPNHHPSNYWSSKTESNWHQRLIWSGSESAAGHYNGYIEGALIASHNALNEVSAVSINS